MSDAQLISLVIALAVTPLTTLTFVLIGRNAEQRYIQAEVGKVDAKIETYAVRAEARFDKLDGKLDRIEAAMLKSMGELDGRVQSLEERVK